MNPADEHHERLLIEAAQQDPSRFAELYEENFGRVWAFVIRRVRDRSIAQDVTSEVFHQALANMKKFEWRGVPFAAWLYRIAANAIADHFARTAREHEERRSGQHRGAARKEPGVGPRPAGYHTITPFLHAKGARALISFLENAFGAMVEHVTEMAGREVAHAGVRIGDSMIELGEAHDDAQPMAAAIHIYVPDVDATYERALRAGARSVRPPADAPYGERGAFVIDPFENHWYIATVKA